MDARTRLVVYQQEARGCARCRDLGLLYEDREHGWSRPLFHRNPTCSSGLLIVLEAPNKEDTFSPAKGHLTCGPKTDPTGQFLYELLTEVLGVTPEDVVFTNAVLCLPKRKNDRYPVTRAQREACQPWLSRLIKDADPAVVVGMGNKALMALRGVERHALTLKEHAGKPHKWFGRSLMPAYHASALGRMKRPKAKQREDFAALRPIIRR